MEVLRASRNLVNDLSKRTELRQYSKSIHIYPSDYRLLILPKFYPSQPLSWLSIPHTVTTTRGFGLASLITPRLRTVLVQPVAGWSMVALYAVGQDGIRFGTWLLILRLFDFSRDQLALCEGSCVRVHRCYSGILDEHGQVAGHCLACPSTIHIHDTYDGRCIRHTET